MILLYAKKFGVFGAETGEMNMKEYNVLQYGAAGDGKTNDAFAIQHAIDDCAKSGGGTVVLQSGFVFYSDCALKAMLICTSKRARCLKPLLI